jgi:hypothetical protein
MINIVNSRKGTLARDNARTVLEAVITASFEVFASIEQSRAEQSSSSSRRGSKQQQQQQQQQQVDSIVAIIYLVELIFFQG